MAAAEQIFETIQDAVQERNWRYQKLEGYRMQFRVSGDDLTMEFAMGVDAERQVILLQSPVYQMPLEKRTPAAIAVCMASNALADGCFGMDLQTGQIVFKMTASYRESYIGTAFVQDMISTACEAVDEFNDKFQALDQGRMTLEEWMERYRSISAL